ncbi:MAG: plasmid mobilization relaxosome protein MobC [Sphingobacteriales bacterium]|nr:MAG: plasmid mobilization relaxosome protein MobC [Sphingobacteriales bacterium]
MLVVIVVPLVDGRLVGASMGRVGNNINQLARYANWLRNQGAISEPVVKNYLDLLEKYSADQKLLEVTLRRIIRLMGR